MIRHSTLLEWCNDYALRRGLSDTSAYQMRRSVRLLGDYLGRRALLGDLDDTAVSRWIEWLESRYAARTRAGHRGNLLCLWRHLAEAGYANWPGRVRRAPIPEPQPVAWTPEELQKIREACHTAAGTLSWGVSRALYLGCLFDVAYQTGLRRGDLWRLERHQFRRVVAVRQHKTGCPHEPQIDEETLQRVLSLPGGLPLAWLANPSGFYLCWSRHVIRRAGVRPGVLQQIRRSGATQLERIDPGGTQRYLGHRTASMKRHYVDRSQAYGPAPTPPKPWRNAE